MNKHMLCMVVIIFLLTGAARAEEYDLNQFIQAVENHSKVLKLAQKDIEMAGAERRETVSLALPHVSAGAEYQRNLKDLYMYIDMGAMNGEDGGISKLKASYNNEYSMNVQVSQVLLNASVFNAIKAAGQYEKLTDFIYQSTYNELITASKQAFYQTLLLKEVWTVAGQSEQNAYENYLDKKNGFENGLDSEFDLLQAEVRYKGTIPETAAARRNYELALISLKNLAGIPVEKELTLTGSLEDYPEIPKIDSLDAVLANRPDYNALMWQEKLYGTQISAYRSDYFPSLAGFAAYNYSAQSDQFRLEQENNALMVGLKLSIPIFQGGEMRAKVSKAKIQRDQARIKLDRAEEDIEKELISVRLKLNEAYDRIKSAGATLETARKAFDIAEATSKAGLTTQLQLKDSRIALDQATVGYYSAIYEYLASYFEYEKVTGSIDADA